MKFMTVLAVATLLAVVQVGFALTPCAPVTLTGVSPNYVQIYDKSPTSPKLFYSPAITITGSNFYQSINGGTAFCITWDFLGAGVYWSANEVGYAQSTYPYPGTVSGYITVNDFTKLVKGKTKFWTIWNSAQYNVYSTNSLDFWIDEPDDMTVFSDNTYNPAPPAHPNVWRQVIYEVHNTSGSLAKQINIGEDFHYTQSTPPCTAQIVLHTSQCTDLTPAITTTYGRFTDEWSIGTTASPAGCGISNVVDHWQACSPNYYDGNGGRLPAKTFATLTGYTHTDKVNILGSITPPQSNHMPAGKKIVP
jgi:hypothetical protein